MHDWINIDWTGICVIFVFLWVITVLVLVLEQQFHILYLTKRLEAAELKLEIREHIYNMNRKK